MTSLQFLDFEVFRYNWCVVIIDICARTTQVIWDDQRALMDYYTAHASDIWVGYNIRHYDMYIMQSILCGYNPKDANDWIIVQEKPGWAFSSALKEFPLITFDVMDIGEKSLKYVEGALGHSIVESSVDFDIERPLTDAEKDETTRYCTNDVEETIRVFMLGQSEFDARLGLIQQFSRPLADLGKTKTQQSSIILSNASTDHRHHPPHTEPQPQPTPLPVPYGVKIDFTVTLPPTAIVKKYRAVIDWFRDPVNWHYKDGSRTHNLTIQFGDMEMSFGWGGGHGALKKYHSTGYFLNADVQSLYPSLMLTYPEYCWLKSYGQSGMDVYADILKTRLELKARKMKREQAPLKIVLNATYGDIRKQDDQIGLNICIYGQILVCVDLYEILERFGDVMQGNTDGILIRKRDDDPTSPEDWYRAVDDACYEWERRTGLSLEFDWYGYGELWQKDVSNYCIKGQDGHMKTKGSWLREPSKFDCNMEVVRKAVLSFFTDGVKPEDTINECTSLMDFQYVVKISNKYTCLAYGNPTKPEESSQILRERCIRVFASKNANDLTYYKCKAETGRWAKLEGCPAHCQSVNSDIRDVPVPSWLDRQWYIDLATERIMAFGVDI